MKVFPACAGMIPPFDVFLSSIVSVPRLRGDDPARVMNVDEKTLCSPLARG